MGTGAFRVRVYWPANVRGSHLLSPGDACRVVAAGPNLPATAAVLVRTAVADPPGGGAGLADEHLVAEAGSSGRWAAVADVLVVRAPPEWATALVGRSPGRLVTVYDGREPVLDVAGEGVARLRPLRSDGRVDVRPYASFAHAWIVAGRPLSALHGACLTCDDPACADVRVSVAGRPEARPAAS